MKTWQSVVIYSGVSVLVITALAMPVYWLRFGFADTPT